MPSGPQSPCITCRHLSDMQEGVYRCPAFPSGVPKRIVLGAPHDRVLRGQQGQTVYAPAPWKR